MTQTNATIESARKPAIVRLEPFEQGHATELIEAARAVASEPEGASRLWWAKPTYDFNDARQFIAAVTSDRRSGHGEAFVVRDEQGTFLGGVSAKNIDWMHGCFQGGYWLVPSARRRGFGQASLRALFEWGRQHHLVRMELLIGVANSKSLTAAESIGAVREGTLRQRFVHNGERIDVAMMAMVADL